MHLFAERAFLGAGISIVAWGGNKGDAHFSETEKPVKRSEYSSSSIIITGSFQMTTAPDDLSMWPLLKPGDMCNLLCPDFVPGRYTYSAMEDKSMEFCVGTAGPSGGPDYSTFLSEQRKVGRVKIPKGSVLIVATGSLDIGGVLRQAPYIAYAKTKDIEGMLTGRGMWVVRT